MWCSRLHDARFLSAASVYNAIFFTVDLRSCVCVCGCALCHCIITVQPNHVASHVKSHMCEYVWLTEKNLRSGAFQLNDLPKREENIKIHFHCSSSSLSLAVFHNLFRLSTAFEISSAQRPPKRSEIVRVCWSDDNTQN